MANLYIMVGIPCENRRKKAEEIVIETKGVMIQPYCKEAEENKEVFGFIEEYLKNGRNVVYNASNLRKKWRKEIIEHFKDKTEEITIVFVDVPLYKTLSKVKNEDNVLKAEKEITMSYYSLQEPTEDEADEIIITI